jgi:ATP-binding cassette subfamily B protein
MFFVFNLSTGIILFYGGYLVMEKAVSLGELVAFIQYLSILAWPMIAFGWMTNLMERGLASLKRINTLLNAQPDICNPLNPVRINRVKADHDRNIIKLQNINFSYNKDKNYILKDINIKIKQGASIGISGYPGSGKTTLIKLILRLYKPDTGKIFIGNNKINTIDIACLRNNIAYAAQESFLFSGTIKDNIIMGKNIPEEKLDNILDVCMLQTTITAMPRGIDTIVGERGITLSGGQKQRIALARTLIQKKDIILLDDPVSQMDTDTASEVINNINTLNKNATCIIVSHRIAALTECDNIYILNNGKIEDQGSHGDLIKQNSFYNNSYKVQIFEEGNAVSN